MASSRQILWLILAGLAGAGLIVLALRPAPEPLGAQLAATLERDHSPLRHAAMLVDYQPDSAALARISAEPLRSGFGLGPGIGAIDGASPARRWIAGADFEFSWQHPTVPTMLAAGLDDPAAERRLRSALESLGYVFERPRELITAARAELRGRTDVALFMRWIRADRGVLLRAAEPQKATREALLLLLPPPPEAPCQPILTFVRDQTHVYVWPLAEAPNACQIMAFNAQGRELWEGVLSMHGTTAAPQRVRLLAYQVAGNANAAIREGR